MTKTSQVQPIALSRRTLLLRGVAGAAGAAALVSPARHADAAKMAQTAAAYQDSPKGDQQCSTGESGEKVMRR